MSIRINLKRKQIQQLAPDDLFFLKSFLETELFAKQKRICQTGNLFLGWQDVRKGTDVTQDSMNNIRCSRKETIQSKIDQMKGIE